MDDRPEEYDGTTAVVRTDHLEAEGKDRISPGGARSA